jgi:transposase
MQHTRVIVTPTERRELESRLTRRGERAEQSRRADLILRLASGQPYREIVDELGCSSAWIALWSRRFREERIEGLRSRHQGRKAWVVTPKQQARILAKTQEAPMDGSTQWSTRKLAKVLGMSHVTISRVWKAAGLKPHRIERYMASNDPQFEQKAADVIGLYLHPPRNAAVFCLDEKTAIQALDRLDPVLPLSPGRLERHGFEYFRHGTLSLYAALDVQSGAVLGKTADRHTSKEFVDFLEEVVATQRPGKEIHVIVDNLSAHKTKRVEDFKVLHPNVTLHYTPTYSSWLNQVELWFGKIERDVIARGVFSSVADLRRKLMRYIRLYNKQAKPFRWTYSNVKRRIALRDSRSSDTGH